MLTRLKLSLTLLMAAGWLLASCTSDSGQDEELQRTAEMRFAASQASRSSLATTLAYEGSQFTVFGNMKKVSNPTAAFVLFNGIPVTYRDSEWTYNLTQYWIPNYEYSFAAVHPTDARGASTTSYSDDTLSCDFSLSDTFSDTPDLLVAAHRRTYEGAAFEHNTPAVELKFVHALSRINFLVKCDGAAAKVIVKEVKLEGVNKSGSLTITPATLTAAGNMTDDYTLAWTPTGERGTLTAGVEVEVQDGSEGFLFPSDNALLVVPQPDNDKIVFRMAYTLVYKNGKTEDKTLSSTEAIGGWGPEKAYTYSLTLSAIPEEIKINVSVEDWNAGPNNGVTVPRK